MRRGLMWGTACITLPCDQTEIQNRYAGLSVLLQTCTVWCGLVRKLWSEDGDTGVYRIPLYEILEEHGFEVYLVNGIDVMVAPDAPE